MSDPDAMSDWPHHDGERSDLGAGSAIRPDELDEWMIGNTFVRCSSCNGSGLGGECECGGSGFDWGHTDEVRALLTKLMKAAAPGNCPACCCDDHGDRETYPTGDMRHYSAYCCPLHGAHPEQAIAPKKTP